MLNKLAAIITIIIILIIFIYVLLPRIVLNEITNYDPYTFEIVLSDPKLREHYGIDDNSSPSDYGFSSEEIDFHSLDGTRLNGWYIPAKKESDHCLIFIHGRTSNRLKPMKYLALIDSLELDTLYNIFIPDLRNSGKSQPAETYMGYKFGEDLAASILLLDSLHEQNTFFLYGFSMGAMAILNVTAREDLTQLYSDKSIVIEKIILDSPIVNVKKTLKIVTKDSHVPGFVFNKVFKLYGKEINDFGEKMKLSALLDPQIPTLIMQSEDDETTHVHILKKELSSLGQFDKLEIVYFKGPGHVKMYQDENTNSKYINSVRSFILKSQVN